jgi:hypothetical protein
MASNNQPNANDMLGQDNEDKNLIETTISEEEEGSNHDPNRQRQIELEEEKKLKAKHPSIQRPGSEFLQKRLQRGQKYFDSGDYNMAKASTNSAVKLPDNATPVTAIDSKILNKRH